MIAETGLPVWGSYLVEAVSRLDRIILFASPGFRSWAYVCFPSCCGGLGQHDSHGLVSHLSIFSACRLQKREAFVTLNPRSHTNICRWKHGMETILRSGRKLRRSQLRQNSWAAWEACRWARGSEFDMFYIRRFFYICTSTNTIQH